MSSLPLEKAPPEWLPDGYFCRYCQPAAKIEPERFAPPSGYDARQEHHRVFYEAVRSRKRPVEDAVFGFRAAGPALLANTSYFEKRMCHWDPGAMTVRA